MDTERWQRLSPLLDALLELDPEARAQALASLREEDPALADDLQELLRLEEGSEDFLAEPLIAPLPGPRTGATVGPYRLERQLGEGGMGQVWLASRADGLYERRVALKLLRPGLADTNLRLRFTRERQILARLEHPHIARLLDAGISGDGQPYLALDFVEGEPITDWCKAHGLPLVARLRLFLQVCDAVSHAHANLIVHRDLKPSNILVTPLDEVRLLDFGIAKLLDSSDQSPDNTRTGVRSFTLHYAAPEQIRGEPVTTMTDVYSAGVVLYELLTDRKPYRLKRQTDAEWEEAILAADPERPSLALARNAEVERTPALRRRVRDIAGDLDNIVLKALAKRPEQRYASIEALALDLERYLDGRPVLARPQSMAYRVRKYMHRHRWALGTGMLVALVLVAALGVVAWQARQAIQEASRAQAMQDFVVGLFEQAGEVRDARNLDVRTLLKAGVERGESELARQPIARAELFGVIARLRLGLGDYPEAYALLQRQSRIVDALGNAPVGLRLGAATGLGRADLLMGRARDCATAMQPLQELAVAHQEAFPVHASEFYSQLGRCRRASGERAAARILFQRALTLRRKSTGEEAGVVENLADLASLDADTADLGAALRGYRGALAQLREKLGPRHPLAIELLRNLCSIERSAGNVTAADRDCAEGLALARSLHGEGHPASIDALRQMAAIRVDQGRFREAEQAFVQTRAWLFARLGPDDRNVARDDNSLGIIAWERGQARAAVAYLDRSIATLRRLPRPNNLSGVLFNKAMVLLESGQPRQALALAQESRALREAEDGPQHPLIGTNDRLIGEAQAALGKPVEARLRLHQAVLLLRNGYGDDHPHTRRARLSLARQRMHDGETAAALREFESIAALPGQDAETAKLRWRARGYIAETHCRGNDTARGRGELQALETELAQAWPEGGELVRDIARLRTACR